MPNRNKNSIFFDTVLFSQYKRDIRLLEADFIFPVRGILVETTYLY